MNETREEKIERLWKKTKPKTFAKIEEMISKNKDDVPRLDDNGQLIKKNEYGNRQSQYGWEEDHIAPLSKG
jgi:hypothetical protein